MTTVDDPARLAGAGSEPPAHPPRVSVVIPTFNERYNVGALLQRLGRVLPAGEAEIVFVDDSTDDTPQVVRAAARTCPVPVTVHHRAVAEGGLGGAVVAGLRLAQGAWVVVMDADLQHPPELAPQLVAAGEHAEADLVVATRYAAGGARDGLASGYRRLVSGLSTLVTRVAFRRPLAAISDPMSGFFAVRTALLDLDRLQPFGFKILLELVVRSRPARVVEVPYTFAPRFAGVSKSSLREGLRFLRHLAILRLGRTRARMLGYGLVGLSGIAPNLAALWLLAEQFSLHYLAAAVASTQVAIGWNFLLTERLLFRHRRGRRLPTRFGSFFLLNNVDLLARIPMLAFLVGVAQLGYLVGTLITLVTMFLLRFLLLDRVVYVRAAEPAPAPAPAAAAAMETS